MLSAIPAAALEKALAQCLKLDPQTAALARQLSAKVVAIKLRNPAINFYLHFNDAGIKVSSDYDGQLDVQLSGTLLAMGRMAWVGQDHESLFSSDIEINGDAEVARQVRMLFDGFDIDWEEVLANIVGDVAAHQLGVTVRGFQRWSQQSMQSLRQDASEYLQEEVQLLAVREDVDAFLTDVDCLRNDVERLEKRLQRLRSRQGSEA